MAGWEGGDNKEARKRSGKEVEERQVEEEDKEGERKKDTMEPGRNERKF